MHVRPLIFLRKNCLQKYDLVTWISELLTSNGHVGRITTLVWSLPISGDKLYCKATVERRNGPSWLRDDDDDVGRMDNR